MHRPRTRTRTKPSKLALTLSLFFLQSLSVSAAASWRPDTELPGAKFVLGDGKNEGSKVLGYEGEWPLWSSFRASKVALDAMDAVAPAGETPRPSTLPSSSSTASNETAYVCAPAGECSPCPEDVIHLPYCRPYNNRRRVACSAVADRNDLAAVKSALELASSDPPSPTALLGWEACGKSARQEARDYFEMIAVVASIAIFSVWAFVQRQKLLFTRQNLQLQSRVTGHAKQQLGRRSSGLPPVPGASSAARQHANRKKRAARLVPPQATHT